MRATVRGPPRARGWSARRELEHDSKDSSTTDWRYWSWRGDSGPFPRACTMCTLVQTTKFRHTESANTHIISILHHNIDKMIKLLFVFIF